MDEQQTFGTLVMILPTEHKGESYNSFYSPRTGGGINVVEKDETNPCALGSDPEVNRYDHSYIAYLQSHKVSMDPITEGYRLTLIYDLVYLGEEIV